MSSEAVELVSTYVSVGISTEGLGKQLLKETRGVGSSMAKSFGGVGKQAGTAFATSFAGSSAGATRGAEKDAEALARAVQSQTGKVKTARDAEAAAARKVAVEEAKLAELRDSGTAKQSQLLAQEDRVATARTRQAVATDRTKVAVDKLADAHRDLKAATSQAESAATGMAGKVKGAFAGITSPFDGLGAKSKQAAAQVGANLKSAAEPATQAFTGLVTRAQATAIRVGTAFGEGVSSRARAALVKLDPFTSMIGRARTAAVSAGTAFGQGVSSRASAALRVFDPLRAQVTKVTGTATMVGSAFGTGVKNRAQAILAPFAPFGPVIRDAGRAAAESGRTLASGIVTTAKAGLGRLGDAFNGLKPRARAAGDDAGEELNKGLGSKIKSGVGGLGSTLKFGLIGAMAGAGAAIGAQLVSGIKGASDLEQSVGGVQAIFGAYAGQIEESSKTAATSLGMSRNAYNELATVVGAGLKNKGIQDYAGETQKLLGLGADLAAQFGGSTQEAVEAISSLMRGEADPIERYGVGINETAVAAELAARGQDKLTGASLEAAKAQARVDLLFRQTRDAQGAFARESDTFAGKQQRAAAQWEDLKTKIGTVFLPVLTRAMGFLSDTALPALEGLGKGLSAIWTGNLDGAPGWVQPIMAAFDVVSGGIGGVRDLWEAFTINLSGGDWGGPQWMWDLTQVLRSFGEVITGQVLPAAGSLARTLAAQWGPILGQIGALFTTVVLPALAALWQAIQVHVIPAFLGLVARAQEIYEVVGPIIQAVVGTIVAKFQELSPQINAAMTAVAAIIGGAMELISTVVGVVLGVIRFLWDTWGQNILRIVGILMDTVIGVIRGALSVVQGVINLVMGIITGDWSRAWDGIRQIFGGIWDAIVALLRGAVGLVVQVISMAWNLVRGLFGALRDFVVDLWRRFWDGLLSVGRSILDTISGAIDRGLNGIRGFFSSAVDGIRTIWDGLREAAAAPVRFVINTVINDGIIEGWNDLLDLLQLPDSGLTKRVGRISIPGLQSGGVVPGRFDPAHRDNVLAVSGRGVPTARVEPGEYVSDRRTTARFLPLLRALPAFRDGGLVGRMFARLPGLFRGGTMPTPGPVRPHGLPYYGAQYAADMGYGTGSPVYAWRDGTVAQTMYANTSYGNRIRINHDPGQTLYAHLSQIAVAAGQVVRAGQLIGRIGYSGNVRPRGPGGAHLHFEILGGAAQMTGDSGSADGGGFFDLAAQWITEKLSSPVRALLDRIPGAGVFADAAKATGTRLLDSAVEKIKSLVPSFGNDSSMSGATAGGSWLGNARLLMAAGRTLGLSRHAMKIALMTAAQESSMGTNRTAMTRANRDGDTGWFQQRVTRGDGTQAQLMDPLYSLRTFIHGVRVPAGYHVPGLYNIRGWQGMRLGDAAQRVQVSAYPRAYDKWADDAEGWLNSFGYRLGTTNAAAGWRLVGEDGPELVKFRGGEQVADSPTTGEVLADMSGRPIHIKVVSPDPDAAGKRIAQKLRDLGRGR